MKKILAILVAALAMTGLSSAQVHVLVSTNGSLIQPSDFFAINSNLVSSAIGPIDDDNVSFDDADGVWTATSVGPALEELNDSINAGAPNGSGSKVHWSQLLGVPAGFADGSDDGSGGGSSVTNLAQLIAGVSTNDMIIWNGTAWVVTNRLTLDEIAATSLSLASALGIGSGGSGATTAAGARTNLGLIPDVDVQAFRLPLLQIATALAASGDMPYRNASGILTNVSSTAAGRTLLAAVDAAAQRTALGLGTMALEAAANYALLSGAAFSGDITVPPEAYGDGWSNSLEVATKSNIWKWGQSLPGGSNAITSVSPDFETPSGVLTLSNTVGTGRIVRESAAGSTGGSNAVRFLFSSFAKDFFSGTNATSQATDVVVGNGRRFARFSGSTDTERLFEGVIPPQANLAGGVKITLHFASTNTLGSNVVWQLQLAPGTGTDPTSTTWLTAAKMTNTLPGSIAVTNYALNYTDLAGITNRQPVIGRILRDQGSASDTEAGAVDLRAVVVEILDSN